MTYSMITDISFLNPSCKNKSEFLDLYENSLFSDSGKWPLYQIKDNNEGLMELIKTPLKKRMSQMSLGVYYVLDNGPGSTISDEEIYLFTGFGEIDTTDKILKTVINEKYDLVSPTLFHNSVHNTPLSYYTIIKKIHNYCLTVSDGNSTNISFINLIKNLVLLGDKFVIVTGEESSSFFELDKTDKKKITSSFASYRITPENECGFRFAGTVKGYENLVEDPLFKKAETVFADAESFAYLKKKSDKNIVTEYPFIGDNPSGIIYRLAMPFYLDLKAEFLVVDKTGNDFYLFEVKIK